MSLENYNRNDPRLWWLNNPIMRWIIRFFFVVVIIGAILKYFGLID